MKKYLLNLIVAMSLVSSAAFADTIITQTQGWQSVPVTVDMTKHTYTVTGTAPTDSTNYYYSYQGYRCVREKQNLVGVNFLMLNAGVSGGSDVYCYPEQ
jgi:hypothetical protein